MTLKLYGGGTRALKIRLVAAHCDVPLEWEFITMGVQNKLPEFLSLNPTGKVRIARTN
jgi:glutathione S-transferase